MKKTILLVAIPYSVHTARWVAQLNGQGWNVHLFPSLGGEVVHPEMAHVTVHHLLYRENLTSARALKPNTQLGIGLWIDRIRRHILEKFIPTLRARQLTRVVSRLQPDIIHSMEMQAAGYLTLEAKNRSSNSFSPWLVTIWGSDIFLFGRLDAHREKIRAVLTNCDYFSCECERDVKLARTLGFKGEIVSSEVLR